MPNKGVVIRECPKSGLINGSVGWNKWENLINGGGGGGGVSVNGWLGNN